MQIHFLAHQNSILHLEKNIHTTSLVFLFLFFRSISSTQLIKPNHPVIHFSVATPQFPYKLNPPLTLNSFYLFLLMNASLLHVFMRDESMPLYILKGMSYLDQKGTNSIINSRSCSYLNKLSLMY